MFTTNIRTKLAKNIQTNTQNAIEIATRGHYANTVPNKEHFSQTFFLRGKERGGREGEVEEVIGGGGGEG